MKSKFKCNQSVFLKTTLLMIPLLITTPGLLLPVFSGPLELVGTIALPGVEGRLDDLAYDAVRERLYLAAFGNNSVEVIDLASGTVLQSLKDFNEPQGICYAPDLDRIVLNNRKDGTLAVIDAATFDQIGGFNLKGHAQHIYYEAATQLFWISRVADDGSLIAIDWRNGKTIAEISLDAAPTDFLLETNGRRIFVNVPGARHIAVIDRDSKKIIDRWEVKMAARFFPIALDEEHNRLFIGIREPASIQIFDTVTGKMFYKPLATTNAVQMTYDSNLNCLFLSGGSGSINIFYGDLNKAKHWVGTAPGAQTFYYLPESKKIFVAVPHRGKQQAEIRIYTVNLKPQPVPQ